MITICAAAGGKAVEFRCWADKDLTLVKETTEKYGIQVFGFCVDSADEEKSSKIFKDGLNSGNVELLTEALRDSVEKAKYLGVWLVKNYRLNQND